MRASWYELLVLVTKIPSIGNGIHIACGWLSYSRIGWGGKFQETEVLADTGIEGEETQGM